MSKYISGPAMVLALAAIAAPASSSAQSANATRSISASDKARARRQIPNAGVELARLLYPASLNSTIVAYTFENIVEPAYRADPNLRALEKVHAGIIDAMIAVIRPEFERGRTEALPALWAKTGDLYVRRLTATELRAAIAFHSSPIGLRLRELEAQDVESAGKDDADVVLRPGPALDVGAARTAFDQTPVGRKLVALRPEVDLINASWNKEPMPEVNARIEIALAGVMKRFRVAAGHAK